MGTLPVRSRQVSARIRVFQFVLLVLVSVISYGALVLPQLLLPGAVPLQPGDVSPSDFQAPRTHEYISEVRTEDARRVAENSVARVYTPSNPSIARGSAEGFSQHSTRTNRWNASAQRRRQGPTA